MWPRFEADIEMIVSTAGRLYTIQAGSGTEGYDMLVFNSNPRRGAVISGASAGDLKGMFLSARAEPSILGDILKRHSNQIVPYDDMEYFPCSGDGVLEFGCGLGLVDAAYEPVFEVTECMDAGEYMRTQNERVFRCLSALTGLGVKHDKNRAVFRWMEINPRIRRVAAPQRGLDMTDEKYAYLTEGLHYCSMGSHWWDEKSKGDVVEPDGTRRTFVRSFYPAGEYASPETYKTIEALKESSDIPLDCAQCRRRRAPAKMVA